MATKPSRQLGAILRAVPAATVPDVPAATPKLSADLSDPRVADRAGAPLSDLGAEPVSKQVDAEVPLQVTVPRRIRRELMVMAADQDRSMRALILRAITSLGIEVAEDEMRDKRRKP